jgi:hypothetical protein
MPQTTIINNFGIVKGWAQREMVLFGRTVEGITKITYKDTVDIEAIMAGGIYPVGIGIGNYKAECSFEMLVEEVQAILDSVPAGTRIHEIPPVDVPILTIRNGVVKKDVIRNVILPGLNIESAQGDKSTKVNLGGFCTHIDWNVQ